MSISSVATEAALTVKLVNPLLESVADVFSMVLASEVRRESLEIRQDDARMREVTTHVVITGSSRGSVALSFDRGTAIVAATRLLGENQNRISNDVIDALSELANIIVGSAKSRLEMGLNIGFPSVLEGPNCRIDFPHDSKPMRIHCSSDIGDFIIDFGVAVRSNDFE